MTGQILTSDQFVAGIIATLAKLNRRHFVLADTELDDRFEKAFNHLADRETDFGVTPNFTFYVDSMHRDSTCLRNTLIAAREKELIALNNPTFHTFDVKLTPKRADAYLDKNPLPRSFFDEVVSRYFADTSE